jgi:hypothetical protein
MFNATIHTTVNPDAIFEARKSGKITLGDFYFYSCIYAYTASRGGCTMSNETIANEIGFHTRSVQKSIANLTKQKFITNEIIDGNHRILRVNIFKDEFLPMPSSTRSGKRDNRDFAQYSYVKKRVEKYIKDTESVLSVSGDDFWNDLSKEDKIFWGSVENPAIIRIDNYNKIAVYNQDAPDACKTGYCTHLQSKPIWQAVYRNQKKYLSEIDAWERIYKNE